MYTTIKKQEFVCKKGSVYIPRRTAAVFSRLTECYPHRSPETVSAISSNVWTLIRS